jgi:hypothetical protein
MSYTAEALSATFDGLIFTNAFSGSDVVTPSGKYLQIAMNGPSFLCDISLVL